MSDDGSLVSGDFVRPCLTCGTTVRVVATVAEPHPCVEIRAADGYHPIAHAWWAGFEAALSVEPEEQR